VFCAMPPQEGMDGESTRPAGDCSAEAPVRSLRGPSPAGRGVMQTDLGSEMTRGAARVPVVAAGLLLMLAMPVAARAVTIDFDSLTKGTVVTNQFPEATFSSSTGYRVEVLEYPADLGSSLPNIICTAPVGYTPDCDADVFVDFTLPVVDLSFLAVADNQSGVVGQVDVYESAAFSATVNLVGNSDISDPITIDLSSFSNVTRLHVHDVTDAVGLGYDDFTFTVVPEPATSLLLAVGLAGLALLRRVSAPPSSTSS
jgi:hypothetical protein